MPEVSKFRNERESFVVQINSNRPIYFDEMNSGRLKDNEGVITRSAEVEVNAYHRSNSGALSTVDQAQ
jgi:hypothetical protein